MRNAHSGLEVEHGVHEFGHAGIGRGTTPRILRNDVVHQHSDRIPLVWRVDLGDEQGSCPPSGNCRYARHLSGTRTVWNDECSDRGRGNRRHHFTTRQVAHSAPAFRCSAMYREVFIESARIVQVGFLSACVTNGPPSATKRFLQSHA